MSKINNSTIIVAIILATLTINLVKGKLYNVHTILKLYYFSHGPLHIFTKIIILFCYTFGIVISCVNMNHKHNFHYYSSAKYKNFFPFFFYPVYLFIPRFLSIIPWAKTYYYVFLNNFLIYHSSFF